MSPRWLLAHALVAGLTVAFVALGMWQLDRHDHRRAANEVGEARLSAPVASLESLAGEPPTDVRYRKVEATGEYDPSHEVLIRSQVHLGTAGFHVITPLVTGEGEALMVNRGWVPLGLDTPPVEQAPPPPGQVSVEGWANTSQSRPALGPEDPEGVATVLNRVDLNRIQEQVPYELAPFYLVATAEGAELPVPADVPSFDDGGPHLAYAIQWFGFATIGAVGYMALVRRRAAGVQPAAPERARSSTTS